MAVTKTLMKVRTTDDPSPASVVTYLNAELGRDNDRCMFVTLFAGRLDVTTGELVYTNAGHEAPYVRGAGGWVRRLEERHGPLAGVAPGIVYGESRRRLAPGDLLVVYTDGVTDAQAASGRVFSEARVAEVVRAGGPTSTRAMLDRIVAEVETFAHGAEQTDDITVLALQFMPGASGDTEPTETVVIRNHLSELDRVDATVERFGERTGLPAETLSRLRIVCDEVLSNVIAYAFPDNGEHDVEVRLAMVGRRLVVRVSDDGIPFDPLTVAPPDLNAPLAQRQLGGLGIHLVRSLFEEVTYERRADRNVLTLASNVADGPGRPARPAEHDTTTAQGGETDMDIHTRRVKDVLVADLAGRLDSRTSGPAATELNRIAQADDRKVLLNVAGLEYVSSAGLRAILVAAKLLQVHGGTLKICHANPTVKQVMEVSGMSSLLHLHPTEADALEAFA